MAVRVKRLWLVSLLTLFGVMFLASPVRAVETVDPDDLPLENKLVILSAVSLTKNTSFIELHNQSSKPVELSGWSVRLTLTNPSDPLLMPVELAIPLQDWLLSDSYLAIGNVDSITGADLEFSLDASLAEYHLSAVTILEPAGEHMSVDEIPLASDGNTWAQRKTGASGLHGDFVTDFSLKKDSTLTLRGLGMYKPPMDINVGIRIIEIVPHNRNCSPLDESAGCFDYIKLFVDPLISATELSKYRVRSDSSTSESSSAFHLASRGSTDDGYMLIATRDDGDDLSLTDSGGYIWLEDIYGTKIYSSTIVNYPSASSKEGYSWAQKDDGSWSWSSSPQPNGANIFPQESTQPDPGQLSDLVPCRPDQERNPETNRCRLIVSAGSNLTPCNEGQERNPETNRCRSIVSAIASLIPCSEGQERNPETNRCRTVEATSLTPCLPGQERNPETNRCRKITNNDVLGADSSALDGSQVPGLAGSNWWVAAVAGSGVIGYGVYEWRREIQKGISHIKNYFSKS